MGNIPTGEKLSRRELCSRIKNLYERAEAVKAELELSAGDTVLSRRAKGIEDYQKYLADYLGNYQRCREDLLESVQKEDLLDFLIEEAVSHSGLFIDLALKLNIANQWSSFPGRSIQE